MTSPDSNAAAIERAKRLLTPILRSYEPSDLIGGLDALPRSRVISAVRERDSWALEFEIRRRRLRLLLPFTTEHVRGQCPCGSRTQPCNHLRNAVVVCLSSFCGVSDAELWRIVNEGEFPSLPKKAVEGGEASREAVPDSAGAAPDRIESLAAKSVGRMLTVPEVRWLQSVESAFVRASAAPKLARYHFDLLPFGFGEELRPDLWLPRPGSAWDFQLFLEADARLLGKRLPMAFGADGEIASATAKIEAARRAQNVAWWKSIIRSPRVLPKAAGRAEPPELRFVVRGRDVKLERRLVAGKRFSAVDPKAFAALCRDIEIGRVSAPAHWSKLETSIEIWINDDDRLSRIQSRVTDRKLARLLKLPEAAGLFFDESGTPLNYDRRPLTWRNVVSPDTEDIGFELVDADGRELDGVDFMSPDDPRVIIASRTIYPHCPPIPSKFDESLRIAIPHEAVADASGVKFLEAHAMPLPEEIRRRVRRESVRPVVKAETVEVDGEERVRISATAVASDGEVRRLLHGSEWIDVPTRATSAPSESSPDDIVVFDDAALEPVGDMIAALGWKPNAEGEKIEKKITKASLAQLEEWSKAVASIVDLRLMGDLSTLTSSAFQGTLEVNVEGDGTDWFDLKLVVKVDDTTLTEEEIALLRDAKGEFVRLPNRGWHRLDFALSPEADQNLAEIGLSIADLSEKRQRFHALQLNSAGARSMLRSDVAAQISRRADEIRCNDPVDPPAALTARLRPYQIDGFRFLAYLAVNRFGGILADDMGLGKTVQALAWLVWLGTEKLTGGKSSLVVCPKSVADTWRAEAEKFAPALKVRVWSAKDLPEFRDAVQDADLHILNYHQLRAAESAMADIKWCAVILDEGQAIKNPMSATAEIARNIASDYRLVMTGTPIENRALDLFSLMSFAMPGILGPKARFSRVYEAKGDPLARRRLAARVRPFLLRRTKDSVAADLPPKVEEDLYCEMEGAQLKLYRAELKKAQQILLAIKTQPELAKMQFNVLTALLRLRQLCCDSRLVKKDAKGEGTKIEALREHIEPLIAEGQKVLVFSQFVEAINLIESAVRSFGCPIFRLTGDTEDRGELVQRFQSTEGAGVFLISLRSGGFGINLTAASYVVLFDPWWNPAVENQAIDRVHRIGQTKTVFAHRILVKNSIEEKIRALQKKKSSIAKDFFGEEKFAQSLTIDDLKFLFADS